jgi:hypothetical protein
MIKAVALLHQRQRCDGLPSHGDTISASVIDYAVARKLLLGPMARALGGALPGAAINLAKRLKERYGAEPFTTTRAAAEDPILKHQSKMGQYLKTLMNQGVVEIVEVARGNQPAVWRVIGELPEAGAMWLPTVEQLGDRA